MDTTILRLGSSLHYSLTNHAVRPNTLHTTPLSECGIKVGLRFTSPNPDAALTCQKCRRALNLPNIIDARKRMKQS